MKLSELVRATRIERKLSLQDVADRSLHRISRGYVSQIENENVSVRSISLEKLEGLALGLGMPALDLFRIAAGEESDDRPKNRREILIEAFGGGVSPDEVESVEKMLDTWFQTKREEAFEKTNGAP